MATKAGGVKATKNPTNPSLKCRVIRRKDQDKPGIRCTRNAKYIINITNPDDKTTITASLYITGRPAQGACLRSSLPPSWTYPAQSG